MASSDNVLCPDWIYSDSSNVHVTKDRAWFTSYHPFNTHLSSIYNLSAPTPVLGIGTIKLTVQALPNSFTTHGISTIELHNVLHAPTTTSNILGRPLTHTYTVNVGGSVHEGGPPSRGGLFLHGAQIAHFQPGPITRFSLAVLCPPGAVFGPSPFGNAASYAISCHWPNEERVRWQTVRDQAARLRDPPRREPPYEGREIAFVNQGWGSEFRFLAHRGLGLREEAERSEGRRVVRALMKGRDPDEEVVVEVSGRLGEFLVPDDGSPRRRFKGALPFRVPFL